jgi:CHAT domain-containing protein
VNLTKGELAINREYEANASRVTAIGNEWAALRGKPSRTAEEEKHLGELSEQLKLANEEWGKFLGGLYEEFGKTKQAQTTVENLKESASGMQQVVRTLGAGTVALYTLVGEEKYRVIVVTPTVMVAREYPITAAELRKKVFEFRQALVNPKSDPVPQAQELYKILVGPAAQDIAGAKAVTLMWSLDEVLRYLPMAALHDGHQYLVEKYRNTVFTPASVAELTSRPNIKTWQGLGMGVSKSYGQFPALPAVPEELHRVIREANEARPEGVLPGEVMLDEEFTEASMKKALEHKYPLVHIASHFDFQAGNETNSFLLLGGKDAQGARLTLAEIREDPGFTFADTELLTLSACDTAVGGAEGDGREVDGLGILAQQKGAKAVVASLWGVYDASTGLLMQEFYKKWTTHPNMSKAEALRQAQVALLRGKIGGLQASANRGVKVESENGKPAASGGDGKNASHTNYSHPYYWAPFILIGNWR